MSGIGLNEDLNLDNIAKQILSEIDENNVDPYCRFKDGSARATYHGNIVIDWVTQEDVYVYEMRREVKRAAKKVKEDYNIIEPLKITIRMCSRDNWGNWILSKIVV